MAGADSWATDAHKTLNVPYDCGVAIVADPAAMTRAFGHHAEYLIDAAIPDPHEHVPELSRRARGVPVWAALASLGRDGVRDLVDGLVASARGDRRRGSRALPGATDRERRRLYAGLRGVRGRRDDDVPCYDAILDEGVVRPEPEPLARPRDHPHLGQQLADPRG